ncbi:HET-domain-containing protein, partial [Zopfia rhizophila CBS 207.26]
MDSQYNYDPLPETSLMTRIIRLKPATDFCTTLQCEIVTTDLDNGNGPILEYEAISYTWEGQNPSPAHYILCRCKDGGLSRLDITANSDAALRRVRLRHEDRYIWMDAVSINQSDKEEKQRQIAYMGYVYTFAKRVLVCLGESVARDGLLTIEYIKKIANHDLATTARPDLERLFDDICKSSKAQKSIESGRNWSLMQEFFSHPWFTRVWTLQEI